MDVPGFAAGDILFLTKVAEKFCRINFSFYICSLETQETMFSRGGEDRFCGNSSVGRAQPCQGWGREFESRFPLGNRRLNPCNKLISEL